MNTATAQVIDHRLLALNVLRANLAPAMTKLELQRKGLLAFPDTLSPRTLEIMAIIMTK
jgi:hypothetical protein